jgi:hypothetical protein
MSRHRDIEVKRRGLMDPNKTHGRIERHGL